MDAIIKKYWWVIIIALFIASVFYWFQLRPAQIKYDCSWVKRHTDATPASLGKTQEEYNRCVAEAHTWDDMNSCAAGGIARPAQPAKDWREKASKEEYDFCIHERGL